jgi:hypothetical protein
MLLALIAIHAALQASPSQRRPATAVRDSTPADSIHRDVPRRLPVTRDVIATAFRDAPARTLFERARNARIAQDSSLRSYEAKVRQRMSVSASLTRFGREHLAFRQESAARVRWQRGIGAHIEMTGARVAAPLLGMPKVDRETLEENVTGSDMSPVPYFPGSETLWIGGLSATTEVDERQIVNPIARGAEAYYTYTTGDSVSFTLPDGRVIQLRELVVRPRAARFNLTIGSLWFDTQSGQLVRAAYRLAASGRTTISVSDAEDSTRKAPKVISYLLSGLAPGRAEIVGVAVEYGLFEGRFWLPRAQSFEGFVEVWSARIPIRYENTFTYTHVNGTMDLAQIEVDTTRMEEPRFPRPPRGLDSAARRHWRDSAFAVYRAARKAREDSIKAGKRVGSMSQCDSADTRVVRMYRYEDARLPVEIRVPCDLEKLTHSPDLPASIYDPGEDVFGEAERNQLLNKALGVTTQAPLFRLLPRPTIRLGPSMMRYNRIEGFSTGLFVEQQIGGGYAATGIGRFGFADRIPNFELALSRTNGSKSIGVNGYRRLVSANDWGTPLNFGSSLSALLFGRDDGFYYRATGAELTFSTERGLPLDWRLFTERNETAVQRTTASLAGNFIPNIEATQATFSGAAVRFAQTFGLDPHGFRLFADLRAEGASSDSSYGRGAVDLTLSHDLFGGLTGALTVAGGSSAGAVPSQRRWFLGGTQTIRGQRPDTAQSGNAFWLTRAELATPMPVVRASLFGDIGWAGDRTRLSEVGRPLSGVGIGLSGFDGLIRMDVARGIYPRKRMEFSFYLNARF